MKNKILWALTLLPTVITAMIMPTMADKIPMHYDAAGNIDRWGSKYESFIYPVIIIVMTLFWKLLMNYFKKKQLISKDEKSIAEAKLNEKVLCYTAIGMAAVFSVIHFTMLYSTILESRNNMTNMAIDINVVTNIAIGILLIILGNVMPKSKLNSIVGVRTVWSMKNDITWSKSNRFGGILLMISGVLIILESAFIGGLLSTFIMLGILLISTFIVVIYSYGISANDDASK